MSTIRATTGQAVYKIERFLGMNENPDGDTKLKLGEASICRNWKVTRDRNLQRRPGFHTKVDIGTNAPVMGMWFGNIHGVETGLAASGGYMWKFYEDGYLEEPKRLGQIDTTNPVFTDEVKLGIVIGAVVLIILILILRRRMRLRRIEKEFKS